MKRKSFGVILSLACSLVLFSGCQKAAENVDPAPPASPTAETVDTAAIEAALIKIENDYPRVIKEKDIEAIKRVEADDGIFVQPDGSVGDKATDVKDMERGALSVDSWEVKDLKVTVLNKDAAVASGRSVVKNGKYKIPGGKAALDISGEYRFVDTFVRRDGEWKLIASATTPIREPGAAASPSPSTSPSPKASPVVAASPAGSPSPSIKIPPPVMTASPAVKLPIRKLPPATKVPPVAKPTP